MTKTTFKTTKGKAEMTQATLRQIMKNVVRKAEARGIQEEKIREYMEEMEREIQSAPK